jgi:hypothetical protein
VLQSISGNRCHARCIGITRHTNSVPSVKRSAISVVVVVIRNVVDVGDTRIADIHVPEITPAPAIPRKEWLTPA